jgi:hypothetical protein
LVSGLDADLTGSPMPIWPLPKRHDPPDLWTVPKAAAVRLVFEGFVKIGSGTKLTQVLRAKGVTTKRGKLIDQGTIYKLLNNRTYAGEAAHKGNVYAGEHQAIVSRELWDQVHTVLQESPRTRSNQNRAQSPALLRGLIFGTDGRTMSPFHTRRRGRLYRYYVSQSTLKGTDTTGSSDIVQRGVGGGDRGRGGWPGQNVAAAAGGHHRHLAGGTDGRT